MSKKLLFALWGGLFILCAGLGFIPGFSQNVSAGAQAVLTVLAVAFFAPPACLIYGAKKEKPTEDSVHTAVAMGIAGGLLGFLIYNFNPAKVFMGDTGSLFLGGAVAALAFAYDMPLILVTVGIMYIVEALSDIIQVGYFKLTHGKRVFRMSPFHHHLEMGGWTGHKWKEKQIVALFAGVTVLFAVLSFIGVFHRFGA